MKYNNHILTKIITILAVICSTLFIACTGLRLSPDTVEMEVENAIDRGLDGIIVYVDQPSETNLYSAGWKNRENKVPADPHAFFKIASISKLYIAVAATKLVISDPSLSLDDTLAELLPELIGRIEYADEITLRMLLQHRSGIPDFLDYDYPWNNLPISNSKSLDFVLDESAEFKPNKRRKYSNTNYLLIGEILDKTLGYSHHQYIKEEILMPLNLNNTFSLLSEVNAEDVMSGYFIGSEPDIKLNDYTQPGGSMVATAEDVGIFLRALIDGSLLTEDEQTLYTTLYEYEHTGLLPGYSSIARYHEDIDAVVVMFINTSGNNNWGKITSTYRRVVKSLKKEN